ARVGQARARARRAAAPGRVPLLRPERAAAVRRPGTRPACAVALLLPLGPATACGGGGARRSSSDRMARARLRARGRPGGAAPDPRATPARECAHRPTRPLRLATQARRRSRRLGAADGARAYSLAAARAARGARAPRRRARTTLARAAAHTPAIRRARRCAA